MFDRKVSKPVMLPNVPPQDRFSGLLFVEKEGFNELITESGILERNDIALASTKGMSVIAARAMIDHMAGLVPDFKLCVLSDFDITGQSIVHTLTGDSDRYVFDNVIDVEHIGISWAQAQGLHDAGMSEPVSGDQSARADLLLERGLHDDAVEFLTGDEPRRVEINALTSGELLDLLERSIEGRKVVPSEDVLKRAFREQVIRSKMSVYEQSLRDGPSPDIVVPGLRDYVQNLLDDDPSMSWDEALAALAGRVGE